MLRIICEDLLIGLLSGVGACCLVWILSFLTRGNLSSKAGNPADNRPHQKGAALGQVWKSWENGGGWCYEEVPIEWMVDTGAQITCVKRTTGNNFRLVPIGGSASGTTGGGGILIKSGLITEFEAIGYIRRRKKMRCQLDVAVKPNDAGSEILGMDSIEHVKARVEWDPNSCSGTITLS